jgi:cytochrome c peroxidase
MRRCGSLVGLLCVVVSACLANHVVRAEQVEPFVSVPTPAAMPPARIAIGERLFSDNRLSRDRTHACTTCHPLDRGGADGLRAAPRPTAGPPLRNTPTIFNAALNASFNWDGVTTKLEDHTDRVITGLMGVPWPELLSRLEKDSAYATAFRTAYGSALTRETVIDAIVVYERTLVTPDSRFDKFVRGDEGALSARERDGYRRFNSYGCASCHQGVNIGGNLFQRFGVFEPTEMLAAGDDDPGRLRITKVARDEGVFRVPSLRNVAVTAPYFHDGRASTLREAVETMGRHQLGRVLDPLDTDLLVDFLKTLTGEYRGRPLSAARDNTAGEPQR